MSHVLSFSCFVFPDAAAVSFELLSSLAHHSVSSIQGDRNRMCVCKCKCVCVPSKPASKQETLCLLYLIWSHLMSASQQPALQASYANGVFALFAKQFFVCAVQNDVKENTHTQTNSEREW